MNEKLAKDLMEKFNPQLATAIQSANNAMAGLPKFLGCNVTELTPGRLKANLPVRNDLLTPIGNLHGGVLAGFVDHILGVVLYPVMKPGQWAATTEFKLNYLAPIKDGVLLAESSVIAMTRNTAVVRAEVSNGDRLVCAAQGTLLIRDPKGS